MVSEQQNEINKKLNKTMILRLDKRLQKLKVAPDVYGKPLRYPLSGIWEIRFEKRWRILYEINYKEKNITIIGFKHKNEM